MCGFAGILNWKGDKLAFNRTELFQMLHHRGPDSRGSCNLGNLQLVHTRLSIVDPDGRSDQPMKSADGNAVLAFNGEIYNHKELRGVLEIEGVVFKTHSDTEVVLHSLTTWGKQAVNRFNGCFSFCYYDAAQDELLLVRDRFGINPLFYSLKDGCLHFGSDLRAVSSLSQDETWSQEALSNLLRFSFTVAPDSILKDVKSLLPGHLLELKQGKMSLSRWHHPVSQSSVADPGLLLQHLERAVVERLEADVEVGTFLSGGVDSSAITCLAARHCPGIDTYSMAFEHDYLDESRWAKKVAKTISCRHHIITVDDAMLLDEFDPFIGSLDEPFGDSSALAYFVLSKFAAKSLKVCLSGDGADELFGGYHRHQAFALSQSRLGKIIGKTLKRLPLSDGDRESRGGDVRRKLQKFAELSSLETKDKYEWLSQFTDGELVEKLTGKRSGRMAMSENGDLHNQFLFKDQELLLPNDMLRKVDMMSMAHGLEVRVPFLDHRLVELVNTWSSGVKYNRRQGKIILKEALKGLIPDAVLSRPKSGFEIPVTTWLRGPLRDRLKEAVGKESLLTEHLNMQVLGEIYRSFHGGKSSHSSLLWTVMIANEWLKVNHRLP